MAGPKAGPQAGFTLLELLAALVVFGLLMAGLVQGVRFGLVAWDAQSRLVAREADLDAVERVLRGLLDRLEPGRPADPPNIVGTGFSLAFTSEFSETPPRGPETAQTGGGTASRRADMLLRMDGGHRLVLRWVPHLHVLHAAAPPAPLVAPLAVPTDTELLAGIERLELAYWSPETGWSDSWNGRVPPRLIRLHIRFPAGDPRHWPDIVAAPQRRPVEG